jgi:hypothetical protein
MQYSEIKNHIIDKKFYWNYGIIIFISLVFISLTLIDIIGFHSLQGFAFLILILWAPALTIGCFLMNLRRCRNFNEFYNNSLIEYNAEFKKIMVLREDYKLSVPYKGYDATVSSFPKPTNVISIETEDFLLLFFPIKFSFFFQLVLKPFIFIKNKEFSIKDKSVSLIRDFKIIETEENRTIIFKNKDGIKKIIIP